MHWSYVFLALTHCYLTTKNAAYATDMLLGHVLYLTQWPWLRDVEVILPVCFLKLILWTDILSTFCEIALRWEPQNSIKNKSTLVQVMAWCHQVTSHNLWFRFMSPYCVNMPQWVIGDMILIFEVWGSGLNLKLQRQHLRREICGIFVKQALVHCNLFDRYDTDPVCLQSYLVARQWKIVISL